MDELIVVESAAVRRDAHLNAPMAMTAVSADVAPATTA